MVIETADGELIRRWAESRDGAAFETLVIRHGGLMRRIALVTLGTAGRRDPGLIDETVQEACVRLMGALPTYRGDAPATAFIAAVARRSALDLLRKRFRHGARGLRAITLTAPPDDRASDPSRAIELGATAKEVLAILAELPEPERSLLYLRDAEGLDIPSLASGFNLPEGTVKSKLARARARVREKILRTWGNP
ncbi:MAG: sigma-70 family RNA polymerase sigma factor [Spirochaetales bacterium]|nr:MAG: sigma-70 family RNA polymerase sigma factor [Spirochaetales bacterium]